MYQDFLAKYELKISKEDEEILNGTLTKEMEKITRRAEGRDLLEEPKGMTFHEVIKGKHEEKERTAKILEFPNGEGKGPSRK